MKHISRNKKSFLWQALLASTLVTAISTPTFGFVDLGAGAANKNSDDAGFFPTTGYNYKLDGITFNITDGDNIGDTGGIAVDNNNTGPGAPFAGSVLNFQGSSQVNGTVGATNPVLTFNLNGPSSTVRFAADVTLSGGINMNKDGTVAFADGVDLISGYIDNTTGTAGKGKIVFEGSNVTHSSIGNTNAFQLITANSNGGGGEIIIFEGPVVKATTIHLNDNAAVGSTLQFNNVIGQVTANITTKTDGLNTLDLQAVDIITGNIGTSATGFGKVNVGATDDTTVDGNIFATLTQFQADNTLTLTDGKTITGNINTKASGTGILEFNGAGAVTGTIGGPGNLLNQVNLNGAGKTVSLGGEVRVLNGVNFSGAANTNSVLNIADGVDIVGDLNNKTAASAGIINFAGSSDVFGTTGALPGQAINTINLKGGAGKVANFQGNVTVGAGNLNFDVGSTPTSVLRIGDTFTVTGNIDNTSGAVNVGTINFDNAGKVTGTIGATKSVNIINLNGAGIVEFDGNVKANVTNIVANGTAKYADTVIVTGAIDNTSGVAGKGTVNFVGGGQVTGNIGNTNSLLALNLNTTPSNTKQVELNGAVVNANVITLNDTGALANGSTLLLNNASMVLTTQGVGGLVPLTTNVDTLNIARAATIDSDIGTAAKVFNLVKVAEFGNTTVDGDIFATTTQFNGNNTLTLTDGSDITGNVTTTANNQGILALLGTSDITGTIGAPGFALNAINVLGLNKTLTIGDNTFANNINIANDGEVIIEDNASFTGNINNTSGVDNKGKLTFEGTGSVSGNIGVANTLNLITANSLAGANEVVTLSGNIIRATNITVNDDGATPTTLKLDNSAMLLSTGIITPTTNNLDILDINRAAVVNAQIGTGAKAFATVKVGAVGSTVIDGDIFATTTQFQANNTLSLTDGSNVNGNIDSLNGASLGILELRGDHEITGTIGATNALGAINVTGIGKTVTFDQSIKANNVNFAPLSTCATTMVFEDGANVTGNIDNKTLLGNAGTLNFVGNSTVTGTIGATKALCQINLQGPAGKIVSFGDDVSVGSGNINFLQDSQLNLASGADITGNIDTDAASQGTVNFLGNSIVNGILGVSNDLKLVQLSGAGTTVAFNKNVNTDELRFTANGTATLASGIAVTGPITTTAAGQGNLTFLGNYTVNDPIGAAVNKLNSINVSGAAGTTVNVFDNLFATNINVNNGGLLSVQDVVTFGGNVNLSNASTLAVAANAIPLTVTGDLNVPAGTTLQFDLNTLNPAIPYIDVAGTANIAAASNLKLTNTPQAYFAGNYDILLVDAAAGGIFVPNNVVSDSLLLDYELTAPLGKQLLLHIDVLPSSLFANRINTVGVAGALDAMAGRDFLGSLQNLLDQLPYFSTQQQLNDGLAALAPIVDGSYMQEAFSAQLLGYGAVSDRIRYLRQRKLIPTVNNHFDTGIASGDDWDDNGHGRWFKLYGQYSDQDVREQVAGYNAETWGLAIGSDVSLNDLNLVGASLNLSHTYVNHDVSDSKSSIYSLQGAIYGEQDFCDWFYFNWVTSVAYNKYTTERSFNFGLLPLSPKADFNGWQFGAKGELGYEYLYRGFHVVPNTSLYYSYLGLTGYNESGAGTANQMVDAQHYSMLKGGIGVRTAYTCPYDMGDRRSLIFQPEVRMNFFYDFINDNMQTTSNFTGGGPSFVTNGFTPAPGSFNVGASLSMFSDFSNYVVTMSYDFETKADYTANAGFLRLRYEW